LGNGHNASANGVLSLEVQKVIKIHLVSIAAVSILFSTVCGDMPESSESNILTAGSKLEKLESMSSMRAVHSSTKLDDGRVLIAGGMQVNAQYHDSAELFDPKTGKFEALTGRMIKKRVTHTATRLLDGRVLIVGGWSGRSAPESSAEIFDPATGKFITTGSLKYRRAAHTATLLADGKVAISGGHDGTEIHDSVEVFNPVSNNFEIIGNMKSARKIHTATLLKNGKILFTGGESTARTIVDTAELFDAAAGTSKTLDSKMAKPRYKHDAVGLNNGSVLVYGGSDARDRSGQVKLAEVFDPESETFERVGDLNLPRFKISGAGALLKDGRVFVAGSAKQPEIFDPQKKAFELVKSNFDGTFYFMSATLLDNGSALVIGGYQFRRGASPIATKNAWIYKERGLTSEN
jgi:hypothetical protein